MTIPATSLKAISSAVDVDKYAEEKAKHFIDDIDVQLMKYAKAGLSEAKFEIQLPDDIQADKIAEKIATNFTNFGYTATISAEFDETNKINYFSVDISW